LKKYGKIISNILLIISLLFAGWYLYETFSIEKINYSWFLLSFLFVPFIWVRMMINGNNYYLLLKDLGLEISRKEAIRIWIKSNMAIYVPGKVGVVVTRIGYHTKLNHPPSKIIFLTGLETVNTIISSAVVVLLSSFFVLRSEEWVHSYVYILVIGLGCILLNPRFLKGLLSIYSRWRDLPEPERMVSYKTQLLVIVINQFKWVFWGIGAWGMLSLMTNVSISMLPHILFTYCSASIIGLIAFFTPSGLGVMEVYITELISLIAPVSVAAIYSIMLRIWKLIGELTAVFLTRLF
jgi:hypothetical protein